MEGNIRNFNGKQIQGETAASGIFELSTENELPLKLECCNSTEANNVFSITTGSNVMIWCQNLEFKSETISESNILDEQISFHQWSLEPVFDLPFSNTKVESIAWSPTSVFEDKNNYDLNLCTRGIDSEINVHRIQSNNGEKDWAYLNLSGHNDYITDCVYMNQYGNPLIASISDDQTCRIWDLETEVERSIMQLSTKKSCSSPSFIKSNPIKPYELMIGYKNGDITFYDIRLDFSILSFKTLDNGLLHDVDWSNSNCYYFGGISDSGVSTIWSSKMNKLSTIQDPSSYLITTKQCHSANGQRFKFSKNNESIFATSNEEQISIWDFNRYNKDNNINDDEDDVDFDNNLIQRVQVYRTKEGGGIQNFSWMQNEQTCVISSHSLLFWRL
eukprot:TRINITY_DN5225_c0_g3_i1.p1 TRINITY_DN5225_c0_g3~~TRINITY_DN5225_c0_g3_i1.p1  ORF type:complete len:388 (+),score=99.41 TRINITY_DN5225_c0_g3_i1:67-1230(+)